MKLKVKDLYKWLGDMIANGDVEPESDIVVAHHTNGNDGLIEDLYFWGLDWIWSSPIDSKNEEAQRVLVIEAYKEPL